MKRTLESEQASLEGAFPLVASQGSNPSASADNDAVAAGIIPKLVGLLAANGHPNLRVKLHNRVRPLVRCNLVDTL